MSDHFQPQDILHSQPAERAKRIQQLTHTVDRFTHRIESLHRKADRWTGIRLATFAIGLILTFWAYFAFGLVAFLVFGLAWIIAFSFTARTHNRILMTIQRFRRWRDLKATHLARINIVWEQIPASPFPAEGMLAADLDLVGDRSIHRLLDTTITYEGSALLRDWLLAGQPNENRQPDVKALMVLTQFRDKLTLEGSFAATGKGKWKSDPLRQWFEDGVQTVTSTAHGTQNEIEPHIIPLQIALTLAAANAVLFLLNAIQVLPPLYLFTFGAYVLVMLFGFRDVGDTFGDALMIVDVLERLGGVFTFLERQKLPPELTHLVTSLQASKENEGQSPSLRLRRVQRIAWAIGIRNNPMLSLILNVIMPYDVIFAVLLNRERRKIAKVMPAWLATWTNLEALSALATFGFLHPEYTFPTILTGSSTQPPPQPMISAKQIGHPLLAFSDKVCNDVELDQMGQVILITGSNMAGKSTFLRTLGVNLSLAYAGTPVNAETLVVSEFRMFTCIRVSDSVTDGFSYFYAEVRRLRALLDALRQNDRLPLFFLIDEIFRGTNNHERLIGSRSFIRALVGGHGVGIISTHDLELIRLADEQPLIRNVHFREDVLDGKMVFDYLLREGPCPTTNALKIMQLEGLPIDMD